MRHMKITVPPDPNPSVCKIFHLYHSSTHLHTVTVTLTVLSVNRFTVQPQTFGMWQFGLEACVWGDTCPTCCDGDRWRCLHLTWHSLRSDRSGIKVKFTAVQQACWNTTGYNCVCVFGVYTAAGQTLPLLSCKWFQHDIIPISLLAISGAEHSAVTDRECLFYRGRECKYIRWVEMAS